MTGPRAQLTAQLDALEAKAVDMLRAGATYKQIHTRLGLTTNRILRLRRDHAIPTPQRDMGAHLRLTVDEAFARHTRPATDGHLLWTGPSCARALVLTASGRKYSARAIAFERHHGRPPDGQLRRLNCDVPDCIAGAHHTDHRIRHANARADQAYESIFGTGATP